MPTLMLFREDLYMTEFTAIVSKTESNKAILNQTCFFPQGGGQVCDTGEINGMRVIDTQKDENLNIIHILASESKFKIGNVVTGKIDWERRYNIMRLQSAAHIVYSVMRKVF